MNPSEFFAKKKTTYLSFLARHSPQWKQYNIVVLVEGKVRPINLKSRDEEILEKYLTMEERKTIYFASSEGKENAIGFLEKLTKDPALALRKFYIIVDADLDVDPKKDGIFFLPCYEIENLLIEKKIIEELVKNFLASDSGNPISVLNSYKLAIKKMAPFFVANKFLFQNKKMFCTKKIDSKSGLPIPKRVDELKEEIEVLGIAYLINLLERECLSFDKDLFFEELEKLESAIEDFNFLKINTVFKGKYLLNVLRLAFQENHSFLKSEKKALILLPDTRYLTDATYSELTKALVKVRHESLYNNAIGKIFQKIRCDT